MTRKQIEEDLHDCVEEYIDFEIDFEEGCRPAEEVKVVQSCPHLKYKFCFPAGRRHDVYSCVECGHVIYKSWDETATTTYKDRV